MTLSATSLSDSMKKSSLPFEARIDEDCLNYDDFLLDRDSFIDKTIKIKGFCRNLYDDKYYLYKSNQLEDRLNSISLSMSDLSREERKWLLENCKKGQFVVVKAVVEKYDLKVTKIEEIKQAQ